jgi:hypothetical protein
MPASLEAALVFAVLIVPGLLLLSGYNRTRTHSIPSRDLYALAQAVVASLGWIPFLWLLGGRRVVDWIEDDALRDHVGELVVLLVLNLATPLLVGFTAGKIVDWITSRPQLDDAVAWTGVFEPPTAWERLWSNLSRAQWAAVSIELKDGQMFHVLFDDGAKVGLSPGPRYCFFDTEYHLDDDGNAEVEEHEGIFIDAGEVVSVRVEFVEP